MSRSFRCRHLPMVRTSRSFSSARHISDGARGMSWKDIRETARAVVESEFGPRPDPGVCTVHIKGVTHGKYHYAELLRDQKGNLVRGPFGFEVIKPAWTEKLPGRVMTTWEAWAWDQEVERVERSIIVPISPWHPLQRHGQAIGRKKNERVNANRQARRRTRQILRSEVVDEDWEGHLPGRRDYFDWWDIY